MYPRPHRAGIVKQTLAFDELQGSPLVLNTNKDYLAAVTENNYVRVFKVAGREAKPHAGPGERPDKGRGGRRVTRVEK